MKISYSNYVMKMAKDRKILIDENEFISQAVDKYFTANKVSVQLSVVPFHLLKFAYGLRKKSMERE